MRASALAFLSFHQNCTRKFQFRSQRHRPRVLYFIKSFRLKGACSLYEPTRLCRTFPQKDSDLAAGARRTLPASSRCCSRTTGPRSPQRFRSCPHGRCWWCWPSASATRCWRGAWRGHRAQPHPGLQALAGHRYRVVRHLWQCGHAGRRCAVPVQTWYSHRCGLPVGPGVGLMTLQYVFHKPPCCCMPR